MGISYTVIDMKIRNLLNALFVVAAIFSVHGYAQVDYSHSISGPQFTDLKDFYLRYGEYLFGKEDGRTAFPSTALSIPSGLRG